ncbi:MAG TPA: hypothetical protein DEH78_06470 [Solibacterales bacterium]|nr:hypothetical protein [Bryobacterales bacterium]
MIPFEEENKQLGWWWESKNPIGLPSRQQFSLFSWLSEHKRDASRMAAIRDMMRTADPTIYLLEDDDVLWHLVARLYVGEAIFFQPKPEPQQRIPPKVLASTPPAEAAAGAGPRPSSSAPREETEAPTLGANSDAAAQAAALVAAAESGVPFCEECLRQGSSR